tara:strand:+ start:213 stop:395 length:183 start_codon:yes stop_codon:yes gene_type:complete
MSKEPTTDEEWRRCITVDCGLSLSLKYVKERIAALNDDKDYHIQQFIKIWGSERHSQTVV